MVYSLLGGIAALHQPLCLGIRTAHEQRTHCYIGCWNAGSLWWCPCVHRLEDDNFKPPKQIITDPTELAGVCKGAFRVVAISPLRCAVLAFGRIARKCPAEHPSLPALCAVGALW